MGAPEMARRAAMLAPIAQRAEGFGGWFPARVLVRDMKRGADVPLRTGSERSARDSIDGAEISFAHRAGHLCVGLSLRGKLQSKDHEHE